MPTREMLRISDVVLVTNSDDTYVPTPREYASSWVRRLMLRTFLMARSESSSLSLGNQRVLFC